MNPISDILGNPRVIIRDGFTPDDDGGCFFYRFGSKRLFVIVSWGDGWEHASVSVGGDPNVVPTWDDMSAVHRLVWGDEPAMQLHVARSDHVNYHPGVLHLWRPTNGAEIPLPPSWMVGPGKKVQA